MAGLPAFKEYIMRELEKMMARDILNDHYEYFHNLTIQEKMYLWWRRFTKEDLLDNISIAQGLADQQPNTISGQKLKEESEILWHILKIIEMTQQGRFDGYYSLSSNYDESLMNDKW